MNVYRTPKYLTVKELEAQLLQRFDDLLENESELTDDEQKELDELGNFADAYHDYIMAIMEICDYYMDAKNVEIEIQGVL